MKEFILDGLNIIDYEGDKTPLVFIHAFPLDSRMWKSQVEFFKSNFRVITYDVRGLGKSKCENNQFTMESYTNDLLKVIEFLRLEKVFACGLSMGGYILLRSYMKSPDKFKGIILADTRAERDDDNGIINRSNVIARIICGKRNDFISGFLPKLICKNKYEDAELRGFLESVIEENSNEGICGAQLALATRINMIEYIKDFNVPALIIVGDEDELTPKTLAENMNKNIKNSILKVIKGSGHLSNLENPDEFNGIISEFLKSNS
jgi:3-oxoadipate enol-lactonase